MASAAFLRWPPGHNLAPLAPGVVAKTRGGPVTQPAAAVAPLWWPHAHGSALSIHARTSSWGQGGRGIFRANNRTNGTKQVLKTHVLSSTTRQRHGARLTGRGARGREPRHREAHPGREGTSGTDPVSLHLSIQAKVLQVSPQSAQRAPRSTLAPREHVRRPCPRRLAAAQGGGGPGGGPGGGTGWVAAACRSRRVRWEKPLVQRRHWKRSVRWVRMWTLRELF